MARHLISLTVDKSVDCHRLDPAERAKGRYTALAARSIDSYGIREYGSSAAIAAQRAIRELVERGLDGPPRDEP